MTKTLHVGWMIALLGLSALGCSGDDDDDAAKTPAALEITGEYTDNFGGEQIITESAWNTLAIVEYDNAKNVVYTQAADDDMFNPSKFGKTVYTEPADGSFYFCMLEYDLDTLAEAKASDSSADDSDPDNGGCNDFPWTRATEK